jgi:hypothetical protein
VVKTRGLWDDGSGFQEVMLDTRQAKAEIGMERPRLMR